VQSPHRQIDTKQERSYLGFRRRHLRWQPVPSTPRDRAIVRSSPTESPSSRHHDTEDENRLPN